MLWSIGNSTTTGADPISITQPVSGSLRRELDTTDAVMLGLGSILGTGIFVSVGIAAGIAGPSVLIAIALAGCVAACNALSAAQLAAAHPLSGGTYEYGYQYLNPVAGFTAGWMFLLAKSASAATAALGFAGYAMSFSGVPDVSRTVVACAAAAVLTLFILAGIRKSSRLNSIIISFTLFALLCFVATAAWYQKGTGSYTTNFAPFFRGDSLFSSSGNVFHATALMFVAYAGYARITTLAEEVKDPERTIPKAIIVTLAITAILYMAVALAGIGATGADFLAGSSKAQAAPLAMAAERFGVPLVPGLIAAGAATAMLGVLLNLILGLSRVLLAMGRRGDMPQALARVGQKSATPWIAVLAAGVVVTGLTLIGSVKITWSFSAFTVLIYYAITNAAALALPPQQRLYPRWIAVSGLAACVLLAFQLDRGIWLIGLAVIVAGILWFYIAKFINRSHPITSLNLTEIYPMNPFRKLIQTSDSPLIIIIRIMVGVVFLLEGVQKFLYPDDLGVGRFVKIGIPAPEILAPFTACFEIGAGLCVLLGLLTRPAAVALSFIMIVAIISIKIPILLGHGFWDFSLRDLPRYGFLSMAHEMRTDWSMLLGSIFLILAGGGRWSVDRALARRVQHG